MKESIKAKHTQPGGEHYKNLPIQLADFWMANQIPTAEGTIMKYLVRWRNKNGIADLKKAQHLLQMLIEFEEDQLKK